MADINTVVKNLQRRFSRALTERDMRDLGRLAANMIRKRVRSGRGVKKTGGNTYVFDELTTQYINFRERSKLHNTTSPSTSNLTFTGKMLRSIRTISVKTGTRGKSELIVGPSGKKNIKKAEWVSDQRPFDHLAGKEIRSLIKLMTARIKNNVKSN